MATIRSVWGMLCLALCWSFTEPSGHLLGYKTGVEGLLVQTVNCQLPTENNYFNRSLPRGQFHFSLMKNETKPEPLASSLIQLKDNKNRLINQGRNDASTLKSNTWPAVPAYPTLIGSVYNGLKLRRNKVKGQHMIEQSNKRVRLLAIAQSQLHVREKTGHNDGAAVEKYLAYTGNRKGDPWCASFVSWVYGQAGYAAPRTAWSPALFPKAKRTKVITPAVVFGIYFAAQQRIAHVGLVIQKRGNWLYTIEGNTDVAGGREGDGVYRKLRHVKTIVTFADWLPKEGGKP